MSQSSFVSSSGSVPHILHTQFNSAPEGFFDEDNILFIQSKISEVLAKEFKQRILVSRGDIVQKMAIVAQTFLESIPKMNQRVIMDICSDFRRYQLEVDRNLKLEAHYTLSQRLYDPSTEIVRYDPGMVKMANRLGETKVGGTSRFYFT